MVVTNDKTMDNIWHTLSEEEKRAALVDHLALHVRRRQDQVSGRRGRSRSAANQVAHAVRSRRKHNRRFLHQVTRGGRDVSPRDARMARRILRSYHR